MASSVQRAAVVEAEERAAFSSVKAIMKLSRPPLNMRPAIFARASQGLLELERASTCRDQLEITLHIDRSYRSNHTIGSFGSVPWRRGTLRCSRERACFGNKTELFRIEESSLTAQRDVETHGPRMLYSPQPAPKLKARSPRQ